VNSVIDYMVLLIYQLFFLGLLAYNGSYNVQGKTSDSELQILITQR